MNNLFRLFPSLGLFLLCLSPLSGQTVQAVIADRSSREVIPDVFVFLANSSIGTASDEAGIFELELTETKEIVLVFSHINYELLTIEIADARILRDTFFLQPIKVELNEAVVVEKSRSRLRDRRLKAFTKAFLGEDTRDKYVRITNPEVLLFRQTRDKMEAEAKEPLVIENRRLGYSVQFYLEDFGLFDNGDLYYKGNTFFQPLEGTPQEELEFQKNRRSVYKKSSRSFFSDLVQKQLDTTTYVMGFSRLDNDQNFVDFNSVNPSSLNFQSQGEEAAYQISVYGFLTVINQNILVEDNLQAPSKAELNSTSRQFTAKGPQHATSYLRSRSNKILVNKYGKILNPSDIEEYGYWASLRVSALLPSDYAPE
ncbi:carboxypeptidase-like regulatory domain-containing protein [Flavilitoribacter nigricans]|uniref:Carboxypeptidase-like regulatory domain-containing protein n=1 Tax=Flavilitoribacter nigricans (strain ATCC 23147 / DSM 23189 / NBRC 102662 / NCIMB 1420 / SS-2) TaxID=1122177 RepID=A0A2D0N6T9_FLAN2|nr:carboxypeptidase-like regulatory domain-containing protein [Flavilitoribacter nigricans]PHN04177.1 hypothetical protein CRP01_23575 [Flavilitoribacter nigricans DSM 23189 = NBRC 102662]